MVLPAYHFYLDLADCRVRFAPHDPNRQLNLQMTNRSEPARGQGKYSTRTHIQRSHEFLERHAVYIHAAHKERKRNRKARMFP